MGSELLTTNHNDNVSQDVPTPEAIKVKKNITGMAGELDTAVSRWGHFVFAETEVKLLLVLENHPAYQEYQTDGLAC